MCDVTVPTFWFCGIYSPSLRYNNTKYIRSFASFVTNRKPFLSFRHSEFFNQQNTKNINGTTFCFLYVFFFVPSTCMLKKCQTRTEQETTGTNMSTDSIETNLVEIEKLFSIPDLSLEAVTGMVLRPKRFFAVDIAISETAPKEVTAM